MTAPTPEVMPARVPADTLFWTAFPGRPSAAVRRARLRDDLAYHAEQLARALQALRGPADEDLALEKYFRVAARFSRAHEAFTAALDGVEIPIPHVADRST